MGQPIIIIGMHRSGTSLVARLLSRLGLFIGNRLDDNEEALFFSRLNSWVLSACGGRWDTPRCVDYLFADPEGVGLVADVFSRTCTSARSLEFLGLARYLRYSTVFNLVEPWGWKDPRSTLTLPIWLDVFPQAKVLHVVRNGIDVAASLRNRQCKGFLAAKRRYAESTKLAVLRGKRGWFGVSPRVQRAEEGVALWAEYLEYAERFTPASSGRLLELRYEDLLLKPKDNLKVLVEFCGLNAGDQDLERVSRGINASRAYGNVKDSSFDFLRDGAQARKWFEKYRYDFTGSS